MVRRQCGWVSIAEAFEVRRHICVRPTPVQTVESIAIVRLEAWTW
jgi:hypothetical protein